MTNDLNKYLFTKLTRVIGANIKKYRLLRLYSQSDLANVLGISYQQIKKYETGENKISAAQLFILSDYLDCDIKLFFVD